MLLNRPDFLRFSSSDQLFFDAPANYTLAKLAGVEPEGYRDLAFEVGIGVQRMCSS